MTHVYQPMDVGSMSLAQVAELTTTEQWWPSIMQRILDCIDGAWPVGWLILAPGGTVIGQEGGRIVASVKALLTPTAPRRVSLDDETRGLLVDHARPHTVPSLVFSDGVAVIREERRLLADGLGDLLEVLHHFHRRWTDYRIPVVRVAHDSVQP